MALGHLSDLIGRERAWTLAGLGFALRYGALLALRVQPLPVWLGVVVAARGILGYGLASVFGAIPAEVFQGRQYGTLLGTLNVFSNTGAGLGPWLTGLLYDRTGDYAAAFGLALGASLLSAGAIWPAAPRQVHGGARRGPRPPR